METVLMPRLAAELLPADLLARASLRGNEHAWPVDDIPDVIDAARKANLVSIGGQLQFRLPDGGTCECYWVQVDTYQSVDKVLPWPERVTRTAEAGARDFAELRRNVDFLAAGREGFAQYLDKEIAEGRDPLSSMCFVWDLLTEQEAMSEGF
ncbi:MAG TPA: hypothetical protein PKY87_17075 [Terricaulis sp.]|nr:hypothetical protein [Terricaulis sp.]